MSLNDSSTHPFYVPPAGFKNATVIKPATAYLVRWVKREEPGIFEKEVMADDFHMARTLAGANGAPASVVFEKEGQPDPWRCTCAASVYASHKPCTCKKENS